MGAVFGKSKPVADSARNVILRRKKDLPPIANDAIGSVSAVSESNNSVSVRRPVDLSLGSENQDFSPEMIREMSNWGSLVKTASLKAPTIKGEKIEMASMIRHAEDKLNLKASQGIAGRLTEVQVIQLFSEIRFTERDFRELGNEFLVSEDDVRKLSRIARMPVIYTDKATDEIAAR